MSDNENDYIDDEVEKEEEEKKVGETNEQTNTDLTKKNKNGKKSNANQDEYFDPEGDQQNDEE